MDSGIVSRNVGILPPEYWYRLFRNNGIMQPDWRFKNTRNTQANTALEIALTTHVFVTTQ
jgi:hypothetical protein